MAEFQVNPAAFAPPGAQEPQPVTAPPTVAVGTDLPSDRAVTSFDQQDTVRLRDGNSDAQQNGEDLVEIDAARQAVNESSVTLRLRFDQNNNRIVLELIDVESQQVFSSNPRSVPVSNIAVPAGNEALNNLLESL